MPLKTSICTEINLSDTIRDLNDKDRIEWITALLETISEEGTIDSIRDLVAKDEWDDQKLQD